MTSEEAYEQFSAAYDGLLSDAERADFEAALSADAALQKEYDEFKSMLSEAHQLALDDDDDDGPDLLGGVQDKIRKRSRGRFYRDRFSQTRGSASWMPILIGAAVILVVGVAWFAMSYVEFDESSVIVPAGEPAPDPAP
ncbi:MAG: hypothetical protein AAGF12_11580 [Myxococcota bacterium]